MQDEYTLLGLAEVRKNRGITLREIAESTKISLRCLEAIERGDFRQLPGGVYTTSYLRQYAQAIDFDESILLAEYRRQVSAAEPAANRKSGRSFLGSLRPSLLTNRP
jgi:cytoskeletal protein RodZ